MFAPCQRVKVADMHCSVARRAAFRAVLAVALLTALPACKQSSADRSTAGATGTVATEPAPTTTTNPYAVPAVIDVAYVNRVLAGLDAVMGDTVRLVVRTRTIPREAYDRLRAIYGNDDALQLAIDLFQDDMRRNFAGYKSEPGNKVSTVAQLISARANCVFARVTRDYSAVGTNPRTADVQWVAIRPLDAQRDPDNYNQTSWALTYDGFPPDRTQPKDPCGG
jgi:hypothetical protein